MYGCYDSFVLYGFCETNPDIILDSEWFNKEYGEDIVIGALDVVRNYIGEVCYGVYCTINNTTGKIVVDNETNQVEALYTRFINYKKKNDENYNENNYPPLRYYNVIRGDYGCCQELYELDE